MTNAGKTFSHLFIFLLTALLLVACAVPSSDVDKDPTDSQPPVVETDDYAVHYNIDLAAAAKAPTGKSADDRFVSAVTEFSGTLFGKGGETLKAKGKNVVLSPLSVTYALTFTANGASGETLAEFNQLNGGIDVAEMNEYLFQNALRLASTEESKVTIANAVWADTDFPINSQFRWIGQKYYNADAFNEDFTSTETVDKINKWVSDKTDGMIDKVMEAPPADLKMILMNTVLFDGAWKEPYSDYAVKDRPFTTYDGREIQVPLMYSYELTYFAGENYEGFTKAYTDGYEFVAILPEEGTDVYDFAGTLDWTDAIHTALHGEHDRADCYLPKFSYETKLPLAPILQEMGLTKAFTEEAELQSLAESGGEALFISEVNQKAKITLSETGTKAAAYTEVCIAECEYPTVMLNRPFVYALVDGETGLPLFMGILADPSTESSITR